MGLIGFGVVRLMVVVVMVVVVVAARVQVSRIVVDYNDELSTCDMSPVLYLNLT
jgi:hypothetical protein